MSLFARMVFVCLLWTCFATQGQEEEGLDQLIIQYKKQTAELDAPLTAYNKKYDEQLGKLETQAKKAGKLNWVIAVRAERKVFATTGVDAPEDFSSFTRIQGIYRKERERLMADALDKRTTLASRYQTSLGFLKKRLTQQGRIKDAILVKVELARLEALAKSVEISTELFSDSFSDRNRIGESWITGANLRLDKGRVEIEEHSSWLKTSAAFSGNVIAELDVERGHAKMVTVKWRAKIPKWSYRLRFGGGSTYGELRFEEDGRPVIQLGKAIRKIEGKIESKIEGEIERKKTAGKLVLRRTPTKWQLEYSEDEGQTIKTPWVKVKTPERNALVIHISSLNWSVHGLGKVTISPLSKSELPAGEHMRDADIYLPELPDYLDDYPMVEGFAKIVKAPNKGSHTGDRGEPIARWWTGYKYKVKRKYILPSFFFIQWDTAIVPLPVISSTKATFVWEGASGARVMPFELTFNGSRLLSFESGVMQTKTWTKEDVSLHFEYRRSDNGPWGIYFLTVPRKYIRRGADQRIRIAPKSRPARTDIWVAVQGHTDALASLKEKKK